jgi:hypothetical protein
MYFGLWRFILWCWGGGGAPVTEPGRPCSDTERVGLAATLLTVTPEMICEILDVVLIEVLNGFIRSVHWNTEIVPRLDHDPFLSIPFNSWIILSFDTVLLFVIASKITQHGKSLQLNLNDSRNVAISHMTFMLPIMEESVFISVVVPILTEQVCILIRL